MNPKQGGYTLKEAIIRMILKIIAIVMLITLFNITIVR